MGNREVPRRNYREPEKDPNWKRVYDSGEVRMDFRNKDVSDGFTEGDVDMIRQLVAKQAPGTFTEYITKEALDTAYRTSSKLKIPAIKYVRGRGKVRITTNIEITEIKKHIDKVRRTYTQEIITPKYPPPPPEIVTPEYPPPPPPEIVTPEYPPPPRKIITPLKEFTPVEPILPYTYPQNTYPYPQSKTPEPYTYGTGNTSAYSPRYLHKKHTPKENTYIYKPKPDKEALGKTPQPREKSSYEAKEKYEPRYYYTKKEDKG